MNRRNVRTALGLLTTVAAFGAPALSARAAIPAARDVYYYVYSIPEDLTSDIALSVRLSLTAVEVEGSAVGWEITYAEFREPGTTSEDDVVWYAEYPAVDTADGLWWVEHADPSTPVLAEFATPPRLVGTATAVDSQYADLEYDLQGAVAVSETETETKSTKTALTFNIHAADTGETMYTGVAETVSTGEDEPPTMAGSGTEAD